MHHFQKFATFSNGSVDITNLAKAQANHQRIQAVAKSEGVANRAGGFSRFKDAKISFSPVERLEVNDRSNFANKKILRPRVVVINFLMVII